MSRAPPRLLLLLPQDMVVHNPTPTPNPNPNPNPTKTEADEGEVSSWLDTDAPLPPHLYLALLRQCRNHKALFLPQSKQLYRHILRHHRHTPLPAPLAESLVMTLASCGALQEALHASCAFPHWTVFSWTSLISAHVHLGRPREALALYRSMLEDGVEPDRYTFVSLFKACGFIPDIELGKNLHQYAHKRGMASDVFIGNTLISMYGKCGDIVEAERVFSAMLQRSVVSWNSMLSAFVDHGHGVRALQLYVKMKQEGIVPDHATSVLSLQSCAMLVEDGISNTVALEIGRGLHSYIRYAGLVSHIFVVSTLVSLYGKCIAISEAQQVFATLSQHDVVSWNVMLSAYLEQGHGKQALQLYVEMQRNRIAPDALSFTVALQACVALAEKEESGVHLQRESIALELGLALHADAEIYGSASDAFVGNTLLSMYGRCGTIAEAEHMFCRLSDHDIVSWNAMLSVYVEQGQVEKTLNLYIQMLRGGIEPDQLTYMVGTQACSILADTEEALLQEGQSIKVTSLKVGRALHSEARRKGFLANEFLASALVSMYGKCGSLMEAEHVFNTMTHRDVVSWNTMLACYVEQGKGQSALHLYRCMQNEGVFPDQLTFMSAIQACTILAEVELLAVKSSSKRIFLEIGKALHSDACKKGFTAHAFVANTLISMYGKSGALLEAENVFIELDSWTTVTWNALLTAYVDQGEGAKALRLYRDMQSKGIPLDQLTCLITLQACSCMADKEVAICTEEGLCKVISLAIGHALFNDAQWEGFMSDVTVNNALVSMLGKCGAIHVARNVFDSLISRTVVSWNTMLSVYVDQGKGEEALHLYKKMLEQCVTLDHITPICILQACAKTGSLGTCEHIHFVIVAAGYDFSTSLAASLIHTYGSCAAIADGIAFFSTVCKPDIMSWNACICGCGAGGASIHMFEQLSHMGNEPDEVTFVSMISACSHGGLNYEGLECFVAMETKYGLTPDLKHYGSVVDLLGRSGDFKSIKNMMEAMPIEGDMAFWLCVLGACCTHGNMVLAKEAFHYAVGLEPKQGTSYVLMSNTYANSNSFQCIDENPTF